MGLPPQISRVALGFCFGLVPEAGYPNLTISLLPKLSPEVEGVTGQVDRDSASLM